MDRALADRIHAHCHDAGYLPHVVDTGIAYAEAERYATADEALSLVVSSILYTQEQLNDGERFAVEPGSW